jgi:SHS2 domain-containing protein
MTERGHRWLEHTADLALEVWADDEAALLAEAAAAITAWLTDGAAPSDRDQRVVELDALDREDRLVRWLNEILFLAITDGFVMAAADIALSPGRLRATVRGQADAHRLITAELKSATYHQVAVEASDHGLRAQVIIDV